MRLSEYMLKSDEILIDLETLESSLEPTGQYIMKNISPDDLASLSSAMIRIANLWVQAEGDKIKSDVVRGVFSILATALTVDMVQEHAETILSLMRAPTPTIEVRGE